MGGIFGAVCRGRIPRGVLYTGLMRLLYRGYDGVGVAYLDEEGNIVVRKAPVSLREAGDVIGLSDIPSDTAIAHTRYSSRGARSTENTHPLLDCRGGVAAVMDGVIEEYMDMRRMLEQRGHRLVSRTDAEVIPHLIEESLAAGSDALAAVIDAARRLRGVYAAAVLVRGERRIYGICRGQPLVVGVGRGGCIYVSSDIPSLYGFADEAYVVGDDRVFVVDADGLRIYSVETGEQVEPVMIKRVKYHPGTVDKAGFPHYMLKEIYEVPSALLQTLSSLLDKYLRLAAHILNGARNIYVIGNGTSLHAGLVASYYFSELAGTAPRVVSAAELPYYGLDDIVTGTVVLAISQSGETSDVIRSVRLAKQRGAVVIGVTNVVGSRLTLESNVYLPISAGPEIAVPATKTFTSTLAALAVLAAYTGLHSGALDRDSLAGVYEEIRGIARWLSGNMGRLDEAARRLAEEMRGVGNIYVSSTGINYPVALEAALKLKEAAGIHGEGVQLGEIRHGPITLTGPRFPVVIIHPYEEEAGRLAQRVAGEAANRGARVVFIGRCIGDNPCIETHWSSRVNAPIAAVVPMQLLSYHLGVIRGMPIDTPPGLAKTVTT